MMEMMKVDLENEKPKGSPPDFKNNECGVAVWVNVAKNGDKYLSIQLMGKNGIKVNAFKYKGKEDCK